MLMALKGMVKRDIKQLGDAVGDYTSGMKIDAKDFGPALGGALTGKRVDLDALELGQRKAAGVVKNSVDKQEDVLENIRSKMHRPADPLNYSSKGTRAQRKVDNDGDGQSYFKSNNVREIYNARATAFGSSDMMAASRLAAVGCVGYAATTGVLNLVRGDY